MLAGIAHVHVHCTQPSAYTQVLDPAFINCIKKCTRMIILMHYSQRKERALCNVRYNIKAVLGNEYHQAKKIRSQKERSQKRLARNGVEKKDRSGLDYLDRAVSWCLFTSAVPLLPGTGPFVCCISALDRFEPHCATWARAASADTPMLMLNLARAPAQHRTPTSRNPGLKPSTRSCPGSSSSYSHAPL